MPESTQKTDNQVSEYQQTVDAFLMSNRNYDELTDEEIREVTGKYVWDVLKPDDVFFIRNSDAALIANRLTAFWMINGMNSSKEAAIVAHGDSLVADMADYIRKDFDATFERLSQKIEQHWREQC